MTSARLMAQPHAIPPRVLQSLVRESFPARPAAGIHSRQIPFALAIFVSCALVGGCAKQAAQTQPVDALPVEHRAERGPVHMTVRIDKGSITIAEKLNLYIEVDAIGGVEVEMPSFGEKLNEFEIMDFQERSSVPVEGSGAQAASGMRRWTQQYVLEGYLSGEQEIPAITARFHDKRDPDKPIEGELATEPFKVQVRSLLAGEFDPSKYRDIKGPVGLPVDRGRVWIWWTGGGLAALALIVLVAVWLRRRRARAAVPTPLLPHEWAFFALQRIEEDRLIETGQVQEFYFRLSAVVREYIERRFGLMAPERTTPEFLAEMRRSPVLNTAHQHLLGDFLQAADMVKFARYEPALSEVQAALGTARAFVDQTTPGAAEDQNPNGTPPGPRADQQQIGLVASTNAAVATQEGRG